MRFSWLTSRPRLKNRLVSRVTSSAIGYWQIPFMHFPPSQLIPHMPQFLLSFFVSTHLLLHMICAPGHVHVLAWQIWPCGHALPQPPQFAGSTRGFTHTLLQRIVGAAQVHFPLVHVVPPVHVTPH